MSRGFCPVGDCPGGKCPDTYGLSRLTRNCMSSVHCSESCYCRHLKQTRSSAVAEIPRDALYHWIFCEVIQGHWRLYLSVFHCKFYRFCMRRSTSNIFIFIHHIVVAIIHTWCDLKLWIRGHSRSLKVAVDISCTTSYQSAVVTSSFFIVFV